jgi:hypothetical protein
MLLQVAGDQESAAFENIIEVMREKIRAKREAGKKGKYGEEELKQLVAEVRLEFLETTDFSSFLALEESLGFDRKKMKDFRSSEEAKGLAGPLLEESKREKEAEAQARAEAKGEGVQWIEEEVEEKRLIGKELTDGALALTEFRDKPEDSKAVYRDAGREISAESLRPTSTKGVTGDEQRRAWTEAEAIWELDWRVSLKLLLDEDVGLQEIRRFLKQME